MKTKRNQNRGRTTSTVGEILLPRPAHVQIKGKKPEEQGPSDVCWFLEEKLEEWKSKSQGQMKVRQ